LTIKPSIESLKSAEFNGTICLIDTLFYQASHQLAQSKGSDGCNTRRTDTTHHIVIVNFSQPRYIKPIKQVTYWSLERPDLIDIFILSWNHCVDCIVVGPQLVSRSMKATKLLAILPNHFRDTRQQDNRTSEQQDSP
jgi:hypothetical protein